MPHNNIKPNNIIIQRILVLSFIGILYTYSVCRKSYIDNDGVYVISKVYSISDQGDINSFKFIYKYKGETYKNGISKYKLFRQGDFILLKISKKNPDLWIHIEKNIPDCLLKNPDLNKYWEEFPTCENK